MERGQTGGKETYWRVFQQSRGYVIVWFKVITVAILRSGPRFKYVSHKIFDIFGIRRKRKKDSGQTLIFLQIK